MANSSRELLDAAYTRLGFARGELLSSAEVPTEGTSGSWLDKGDWLALANKVGAEKVFFVDNYPVVVFAEQTSGDPADWLRWFNSVWCMARPQLLFLAREGELSVLNLTRGPARRGTERNPGDRLLDAVRATAEVQDRLSRYRRAEIESGRLFEDRRFGSGNRADRALIRDLGRVRDALLRAGLSAAHAHSLIGRSIFIRYLEDREVLTEPYFRQVARGDKELWNEALERDAEVVGAGGRRIFYPAVLSNKAFTYALFARLSDDFNGDMFPVLDEEQRAVSEKHLRLLRRFLLADSEDSLFFFAYRFDIIPIELISSIYEKFYSSKPGQRRDDGSYYTPAALVDFVLSQTLDQQCLDASPRVVDPACGSGIFLVEAFRRIVRHKIGKTGRMLSPDDLRAILRDQIAGMDINPEAVRVAAFSLYLALLHYQKPSDILHHAPLPCLTYASRHRTDHRRHYDILLAEDAFRVHETVSSEAVRARFTNACADVVVGNPPWGAPKADLPEGLRSDGGVGWCEQRDLSVGDKERSQTFIHRTLDMLKDGGRAGLLVSTGVFFKRHDNTRRFREQWLKGATMRSVVNFAAVRSAFFRSESEEEDGEVAPGSIAPFASVVFDKARPTDEAGFAYWSAKETAYVRRVQAVILNRADFCRASQADFLHDDTLWKIYWWGTHRDAAIIARLRLEKTFGQTVDPEDERIRVGYKVAKQDVTRKWLGQFREYPTDLIERYGPLPTDDFVRVPTRVHRLGSRECYERRRIIIKRGVGVSDGVRGRIVARFETEPFCFRDSVYGVPLPSFSDEEGKVLLGILWSSVARYHLFLTSGTWGLWHDDLKKDAIEGIPVRLPDDARLRARIVTAVDALRQIPPAVDEGPLFSRADNSPAARLTRIRELETQLDEAVFDLFKFSGEERGRISEMCGLGLDFFYRGMDSEAVQALDWPDGSHTFGHKEELQSDPLARSEIGRYLATYLRTWEPQLREQDGRLRWRIVRPQGALMMAAIFQTENGEALPPPRDSDDLAWNELIEKISSTSRQQTRAQRVYVDGLVRVVGDTDMVIIKRNERRLWTESAALDDAEATMVLAMRLTSGDGK